jgi:hypothetical protein
LRPNLNEEGSPMEAYVGLDVHSKRSVFVIEAADGRVVARGDIPTTCRPRRYEDSLYYAVGNHERPGVADCPTLIDAAAAAQCDPRHSRGYPRPGRIDVEHAVVLDGREDAQGGHV